MMFFFRLVDADIAKARRVVEALRQKAIDLKWLPISGTVHLTDPDSDRLPGRFLLIAAGDTVLAPHEVIFFEATPPEDEARPFGLAVYPGHMEGSSKVVATHLAGWQWIGVIRSDDQQAIMTFIKTAAELGVEVTASVGDKMLTAKQDETGEVRFDERRAFRG